MLVCKPELGEHVPDCVEEDVSACVSCCPFGVFEVCAWLARGCGYMGGGRASTYTSQRSTCCAVGSSDWCVVGSMERVSVAEGVSVVGGVQREMGWWAIAAYVMYTDGELSHGKPGNAKGAGFTASWSKSLAVPELRGCEMRDASLHYS